jgi:hypothetical protein
MYQQVNLYQPIFRRQRQIFSAAVMLQVVAVVGVALMSMYAYGWWQLAGLEAEVVLLEGREKAFTAQVGRLDPSAGSTRRKEVDDELKRLNSALLAQQKLIDVLREEPLGTTSGFSPYLAALGRQHSNGLWLTQLAINGATGALEVAGQSLRAELVPAYLQRLGGEQALAGQRFDRLTIERSEQSERVAFQVSSRAVNETIGPARAAGKRP